MKRTGAVVAHGGADVVGRRDGVERRGGGVQLCVRAVLRVVKIRKRVCVWHERPSLHIYQKTQSPTW